MSDPFLNLKKSFKKTVFRNLHFSEERKQAVKETLRGKPPQPQLHFWKEETLIAVFELLLYEPKVGYDISTYLFHKHEFSFQNNEGQLYTLLHLLENNEIVISKWIEEKKYYYLTRKGKKVFAAYQQGSVKHHVFLKELIEEAICL